MNASDGKDLAERTGLPRATRPHRAPLAALLMALLVLSGLVGAATPAGASATPGKPTAKTPTGTITTTTPTFTWGKVSGAAKYELRVYQGTTQVLKKTGLTKLSWKSATALPKNVDLTWKVRAGGAGGNGAWSTGLTFNVALAIGDAYQGGKIAYLFQSGDPGYVGGQTHGLIAALADRSTGIPWYGGSFVATGATGTALGTGLANTDTIIAVQGAPAASYAAGWARAYNGGGYFDWYLPSKDELNELFVHQAAIGGFGPNYYWSSSEFDAGTAWAKAFDLSSPAYAYSKNGASFVRAVRTF
ncbi:MAG: DUF1566 domain-containing protein [Actinobacteria bacterium]|nr:DUF1566 domain-containing protein [Actinomycetota bacterium]